MPEIEFIKALGQQGIAVLLAGVVIYWYRCDSRERLSEAESRATREREDKLMIVEALQGNTQAMGELRAVIERVIRSPRRTT